MKLQGSFALSQCLSVVRALLYPSYLMFNCLIGLYITTFEEDRHPLRVKMRKIFLTPLFAVAFIATLPILIIFLPIRCLLVNIRQPFDFSERHTPYSKKHNEILSKMIDGGDYKFGVASANLCLMQEIVSKFNHLTNVDWRARNIGERIVASQMFNDDWRKRESQWKLKDSENGKVTDLEHNSESKTNTGSRDRTGDIVGDVITEFPHLDFLVVQEAWSSYHNKALIKHLHKVFPYIIHDVGIHSMKVNRFLLNSGLMIASKHPIIAVDFKPFSRFVTHGKIIAKGLLMTKITLGSPTTHRRKVGYIFNTHLQSYQGREQVIAKQMDELLMWMRQFMEENKDSRDAVLFSVLCGDFNFDNLSPCDKECSGHAFFDDFEDVCRIRAGFDKPWTVGTELRQHNMLESIVASPEGLKAALDDPILRQCYLVDGDILEQTQEALVAGIVKKDEHNNILVFPEGGRRRIDYITYQKAFPVDVEAFHFVTQLATLTDHIPICMEFTCPRLRDLSA